MAPQTEASTQPSSKRSDEELRAEAEALPPVISLEQALELARRGHKFSQTPEQRAQFEAELEAFKRANPLPGEKFTSDAEQPPKVSSKPSGSGS